jgi:hypothetical protein
MLGVKLDHITKEENYLIDVTFKIEPFPQIVLIFDNIDDEILKMDIYKLQNLPFFIDALYDDDDMEVCMFFEVPDDYLDDFDLFIQGKYSKLSSEYKEVLIRKFGDKRLSSYNPITGLPSMSMQSTLYPTKEEKQALADSLGSSVVIKEVLDPPNHDIEIHRDIEELKLIHEI